MQLQSVARGSTWAMDLHSRRSCGSLPCCWELRVLSGCPACPARAASASRPGSTGPCATPSAALRRLRSCKKRSAAARRTALSSLSGMNSPAQAATHLPTQLVNKALPPPVPVDDLAPDWGGRHGPSRRWQQGWLVSDVAVDNEDSTAHLRQSPCRWCRESPCAAHCHPAAQVQLPGTPRSAAARWPPAAAASWQLLPCAPGHRSNIPPAPEACEETPSSHRVSTLEHAAHTGTAVRRKCAPQTQAIWRNVSINTA